MRTPNETELLQAAARLLRESEDKIDELTAAKLRAARRRALDAKPRTWHSWGWMNGAIAAGIVATLAAVLWLNNPIDRPLPVANDTPVTDVELLTARDNPDFYADLEFYNWIADEDYAG